MFVVPFSDGFQEAFFNLEILVFLLHTLFLSPSVAPPFIRFFLSQYRRPRWLEKRKVEAGNWDFGIKFKFTFCNGKLSIYFGMHLQMLGSWHIADISNGHCTLHVIPKLGSDARQ